MPNLASLNQSGHRYDFNDSQNGKKGPGGISPLKNCESLQLRAIRDRAGTAIPPAKNDRRFIICYSPSVLCSLIHRLVSIAGVRFMEEFPTHGDCTSRHPELTDSCLRRLELKHTRGPIDPPSTVTPQQQFRRR